MLSKGLRNARAANAIMKASRAGFHSSKPLNEMVSFNFSIYQATGYCKRRAQNCYD